jgi:membrane protease YdiL (CAAX protease family)
LRERRVPLAGPTDTLLLALLATNYILFAPIAEELLFRGWIYTGLRRGLGFGATLLATSLLFAAIHWEPRHMALVLPLAFALGFIRERTGSIKPTIALHAGYNLVIVTITLLAQ